MYDLSKVRKLLRKPHNNFNKLVKIYVNTLLDYYRHKIGKGDKKSDDYKQLERTIEVIEEEFELSTSLEPYLDIRFALKEVVAEFLSGRKVVPELATLKDLVIYREKAKWGRVVFTHDDDRVVVYLPNNDLLYTIMGSPVNLSSDVLITASPVIDIPPASPFHISTDPSGPNFSGTFYYDDIPPIGGPPLKMAVKLSLAEQYNDLFNYIQKVIFGANGHIWGVPSLDASTITLETIGQLYGLLEKKYGPTDPSYKAKKAMLDHVATKVESIMKDLMMLNPLKKYNDRNVPLSVLLGDALRYTNYYESVVPAYGLIGGAYRDKQKDYLVVDIPGQPFNILNLKDKFNLKSTVESAGLRLRSNLHLTLMTFDIDQGLKKHVDGVKLANILNLNGTLGNSLKMYPKNDAEGKFKFIVAEFENISNVKDQLEREVVRRLVSALGEVVEVVEKFNGSGRSGNVVTKAMLLTKNSSKNISVKNRDFEVNGWKYSIGDILVKGNNFSHFKRYFAMVGGNMSEILTIYRYNDESAHITLTQMNDDETRVKRAFDNIMKKIKELKLSSTKLPPIKVDLNNLKLTRQMADPSNAALPIVLNKEKLVTKSPDSTTPAKRPEGILKPKSPTYLEPTTSPYDLMQMLNSVLPDHIQNVPQDPFKVTKRATFSDEVKEVKFDKRRPTNRVSPRRETVSPRKNYTSSKEKYPRQLSRTRRSNKVPSVNLSGDEINKILKNM